MNSSRTITSMRRLLSNCQWEPWLLPGLGFGDSPALFREQPTTPTGSLGAMGVGCGPALPYLTAGSTWWLWRGDPKGFQHARTGCHRNRSSQAPMSGAMLPLSSHSTKAAVISQKCILFSPDGGLLRGREWLLVPPSPSPASKAGLGDILLRKPRYKRPQNSRMLDYGSGPHLMPGLTFLLLEGPILPHNGPLPMLCSEEAAGVAPGLGTRCPLQPVDWSAGRLTRAINC